MNITIVTPYHSLPSEPHFDRSWYLAKLLSQSHDVLLITSSFEHYDKSFRWPEDAEVASQDCLKVMLLKEGGYSKNVSLGCVTSHHRFAKYFERWLENRRPGEQDVVFSVYPLIATNLLLGKHKARLGYKLITDVQDIWPESFSSVIPLLKKVPHSLLPFASRVSQAYRYADTLIVASQTYLDHAKGVDPNVPGEVVYIDTDSPKLDAVPAKDFGDDKTRFFYLDTLSYSYDAGAACKSVRKLLNAGENVELHIMNGGPDLDRLKQYIYDGIRFYGYIPYAEMVSVARGCDISVNAIYSYTTQSITNKLSDYMALQKPTLNNQVDDEVAEILILLLHANYRSDDVGSFVKAAKDVLKRKDNPAQSEEIVCYFKRDAVH